MQPDPLLLSHDVRLEGAHAIFDHVEKGPQESECAGKASLPRLSAVCG